MEEWTLFILEGLRQTAPSAVPTIEAIQDLQTRTRDRIRLVITGGSNPGLLAVLFEQPYCRIGDVLDDVLDDVRVSREHLLINAEFLDLLVTGDASDGQSEPTLF